MVDRPLSIFVLTSLAHLDNFLPFPPVPLPSPPVPLPSPPDPLPSLPFPPLPFPFLPRPCCLPSFLFFLADLALGHRGRACGGGGGSAEPAALGGAPRQARRGRPPAAAPRALRALRPAGAALRDGQVPIQHHKVRVA